MSQVQLGKAIAVTFQQVQKYERGTNRVSVSTLYGLSQALGVPVWFFFDGMPQAVTSKGVSTRAVGTDLLATQQTQELVRAYYSIPGAVRQGLHQLVRSAARSAPDSARSRRHED